MDREKFSEEELRLFASENLDIRNLQDEIRADGICVHLLRLFVRKMTETGELDPFEAGVLANGADYFLRDFIVSDRRENIFTVDALRIRQFAGNWYIVKTLEPNLSELTALLKGVEAFYNFCFRAGAIPRERFERIRRECRNLDYYAHRIERFWNIEGDGYFTWERECSLRDSPDSE